MTMISGFPYLLAEMNHLSVIPSSLRLLISGGDVLRGVYVDHLLNKAEVTNTYGPPTTTVCAPITVVIVELCWRTVPIPSVILY